VIVDSWGCPKYHHDRTTRIKLASQAKGERPMPTFPLDVAGTIVAFYVVGSVIAVPLALFLPRRTTHAQIATPLTWHETKLVAYEVMGRDTALDWRSREDSSGLVTAVGGRPADSSVFSVTTGAWVGLAYFLWAILPVFVFFVVRASRPQRLSLRALTNDRQGSCDVELTAQGGNATRTAQALAARLQAAR
jgi:hypothetical protein